MMASPSLLSFCDGQFQGLEAQCTLVSGLVVVRSVVPRWELTVKSAQHGIKMDTLFCCFVHRPWPGQRKGSHHCLLRVSTLSTSGLGKVLGWSRVLDGARCPRTRRFHSMSLKARKRRSSNSSGSGSGSGISLGIDASFCKD